MVFLLFLSYFYSIYGTFKKIKESLGNIKKI